MRQSLTMQIIGYALTIYFAVMMKMNIEEARYIASRLSVEYNLIIIAIIY